MKITSSYAVELLRIHDLLRPTVEIYRQAVAYLIDVIDSEWPALSQMTALERINTAEQMVHSTKKRPSKYDFDRVFPKMPAYLRRAALRAALGAVSAHRTGTTCLTDEDGTDAPPLQTARDIMPVFYRPQMYEEDGEEEGRARLKLYKDGRWDWQSVALKATDVRYLQRHWSHCTPSAPILEKRHKTYFLRFTFTEEVALPAPEGLDACAVWMDGQSDAVCAIVKPNGEIGARRFIDLPERREMLKRGCGRIKRMPQNAIFAHFRYLKRLNEQYAIAISHEIVEFARANGAGVIVTARIYAGKQQYEKALDRLFYLRKTRVQVLTEHSGHRNGIRSARVDGTNAEHLSFDQSEKAFNPALNACLNIGARYQLCEQAKSRPAREGSPSPANVPGAERSASCTLATLRLSMQEPQGQESPATGGAQEQTRNFPQSAENHKKQQGEQENEKNEQ